MLINITKGFSLFELIVTISILAIITSIALPHFHDYMSKQEAQSVKTKIFQINRYARSQALVYRQNIVICPSQNFTVCEARQWNIGYIVFIDKNKNRQIDSDEQILHIDKLNLKYGNLDWRGALSIPSVSYQAQTSLPIGSNGSFYYCSNRQAQHQRIVLSKMAMMRTEAPNTCP